MSDEIWQRLKESREAKRGVYEETFTKGCWKYDKVYEDEKLVLYSQADKESLKVRYYEGFVKDSSGFRPSSADWGKRAWTFWTEDFLTALAMLRKKLEERKTRVVEG